jgi:rSAM/selenodomain-associated transferase 2
VTISVIIPVLREEAVINGAIAHLRAMDETVEIIVVDGATGGETVKAIKDRGVKRVQWTKGRARQMNRGAGEAGGEVLLFLHADTELPPLAFRKISSLLADGRIIGGAFDLGIGDKGLFFRIIERLASARSRLTRIPYGDQAIFLRRDYFLKLGGYADMPIMEDVDVMKRIKSAGGRISFIGDRVQTSARRWKREGIVRCTLRNRIIMLRYLFGASPEELAKKYPY